MQQAPSDPVGPVSASVSKRDSGWERFIDFARSRSVEHEISRHDPDHRPENTITEPMSEKQSKLADLLVDEDEVNEEVLRDTLQPYIQIGSSSGTIIPSGEFGDLTPLQKVTVMLLAQKAAHELGLADDEWLSPAEMHEKTGMKQGTVRPKMSELHDKNIAEREDGRYRISMALTERARELIEE